MPTTQEAVAKPPVYLVDGSGYIFRAFYAVQALTNSKGFPTNALFGFLRMLLKLLAQAKSEHVVVVFDAGRETFRNKLYTGVQAESGRVPRRSRAADASFPRVLASSRAARTGASRI
ncbi:MAG: hypothetical protein QY326_00865 [Bdellovibrionota bacterium]|nr:MAG: hypothetical protein QY326_00865 [Bdellovibrionota bacterium]